MLGVPLLTDVHSEAEIPAVAAVVDVLQTPAFLCRQTDFIHAVARCGKPVNIKKGQFLAPHDMKNVIDKARAAAREAGLSEDRFMACERGVSFGYNNLVSDMRRAPDGAPIHYERHRPEQTTLYRLVQQHAETFFADVEAAAG